MTVLLLTCLAHKLRVFFACLCQMWVFHRWFCLWGQSYYRWSSGLGLLTGILVFHWFVASCRTQPSTLSYEPVKGTLENFTSANHVSCVLQIMCPFSCQCLKCWNLRFPPHVSMGVLRITNFKTSLMKIFCLELLRASLCKILISSFARKMDFAHNFSVDFV